MLPLLRSAGWDDERARKRAQMGPFAVDWEAGVNDAWGQKDMGKWVRVRGLPLACTADELLALARSKCPDGGFRSHTGNESQTNESDSRQADGGGVEGGDGKQEEGDGPCPGPDHSNGNGDSSGRTVTSAMDRVLVAVMDDVLSGPPVLGALHLAGAHLGNSSGNSGVGGRSSGSGWRGMSFWPRLSCSSTEGGRRGGWVFCTDRDTARGVALAL